ncbi:MAG: hypothetical protein JXN62_10625, partial [Bacteroidales bacterium]|nr:hypothetical protein [Bacteroidales bacterium]
FAEAIIDGIKSSKLFLLVYTSSSNNSKQVIREVDRAVHFGLQVINLRLEDVPMSKQLDYYLSSVHWLDAKTPPLEEHIKKLSGVVKILLRKDDARDRDLEKAIRDGILQVGQDKKSIAVMPFKNMSSDPEQEYFSDGMMEEILDRLFKIGDMKVISRTSSMRYKNSDKPIKEIARELGVASIVEGSVRRAGNNVRIAVQLIDAGTDAHLWSEIYNGDLTDLSRIFVIQSEVAEAIAKELKVAITSREKQLIDKIPTQKLEAYEAYLKGIFYWRKFTPMDMDTAMQYFELAKEIDPDYAPAYAGIHDAWFGRSQLGIIPSEEAAPKAIEAAMKALELDDTSAEVHCSLAAMNVWGLFDWKAGEEAFKKAIEIKPTYPEARAYYSSLLIYLGRIQEAIEQIELALRQDPVNPFIIGAYAQTVLIFLGKYEDAISTAQKALEMDPTANLALNTIAIAQSFLGNYSEVIDAFKRLFSSQYSKDLFNDIEKTDIRGKYVETLNYMAESLIEFRKNAYVLPMDIAQVYATAGNQERALEWLEKAFEEHDQNLPAISFWPIFDSLRNETRFKELLIKLNLPLTSGES